MRDEERSEDGNDGPGEQDDEPQQADRVDAVAPEDAPAHRSLGLDRMATISANVISAR